MSILTLKRKLDRIERAAALRHWRSNPMLDKLRADPDCLMSVTGMPPDEWQSQLLRTGAERMLLLCSRQAGKSTVAAALALRVAILEPRSPILILSPTDRQSSELFRKILEAYRALGRPVPAVGETLHQVQLANGSRILSLPGTEKTVRGYSGVALLIIDEAARVDDALYRAVRPMAMSTWLGENYVEPYTGPLVYTSDRPEPAGINDVVQQVLAEMDYEDELRDRGLGLLLR